MNIGNGRSVIRFQGKRAAAAWAKSQGFVRFVGGSPALGGGWVMPGGVAQARWVPIPDCKPSGLLVVSRRAEVCDDAELFADFDEFEDTD